MRNLSLKQLQAVAAVARLGTMTRAAQELNVTSAALYARIRQLEEEAGLLLFDRTPTGLKPTDAGREMLWAIDSINTVLETCADKLQTLKGGSGGRVAMGVVSTAKYFTPQIIAGFVARFPAVEINLVVGNRGAMVEALRNYEIDYAIMGRPPRDFAIEAETFGAHPLVIIAAPNHRFSTRTNLTRADLAEESFLVREEGSGTRTVFEEFMSGIMIQRAKLGIDSGSNETIKQAVMAGLGIALISAHTVAAEVESGRMILLDVQGLPIRRDWYVVRRADKVLGPAAAAFWDFTVKEGGRKLPRLALSPAVSPVTAGVRGVNESGIVIIGAGQAGLQAAASLRESGFDGPVTMIGDEPILPYQRPPLSKAYLAGKVDAAGLFLRAREFYVEHRIDCETSSMAVSIDRGGRRIRLGDGREIAYDHLVLATGSRNRPLPVSGTELTGVYQLRSITDADRIQEAIGEARNIAIVGAGFIGLEFASICAARGLCVTVIEAADRPMARAVSEPVAAFFRETHEKAGIRFLFGSGVQAIEGRTGRVEALRLSDGTACPADLVLIGIGVLPNQELAAECGAPCRRRHRRRSCPRHRRSVDLGYRRLRQVSNTFRRAWRSARRIRPKRDRPGTLCRRPHRRTPGALRCRPVVLERSGRTQTANGWVAIARRCFGTAPDRRRLRGVPLSRCIPDRNRDGGFGDRAHGRPPDHRARPFTNAR